jgi:DNA-binding winged helix-turn-helix (wHTH) protein
VPRYRFSEFTLSPRRRLLLKNGQEQPLIPRYFDLLVYLIEHRGEAVHRRDIFDCVWTDVVVSDSALSQAIRTIRRVLGDDSREPTFVRTVSRHGYRFVFADVIEEEDRDDLPAANARAAARPVPAPPADYEALLERITRVTATSTDEEEQREAAERLHALGTTEALRKLDARPGHAQGRAFLRDTRWDAAEAGPVPILGQPAPLATATALIRIRLRRAASLAAARWASASLGGGLAGCAGGAAGALLLTVAPGSTASGALVPVLAVIGAICGAVGGAGVGAGLSLAEAIMRSRRVAALTAGAAIGGALVGFLTQWLARSTLATLVGVSIESGGGLEGFLIGGAAGLAYALATSKAREGLAAPRGRGRVKVVVSVAAGCSLAALVLSLAGRPLVGGHIHAIAKASRTSQSTLTPLGRLIGEPDFGPISAAVIATGEGALFGIGLALGLTHRAK